MALHLAFPASPYEPLIPEHRWFPADEALRDTAYDKLLAPLVARIRKEVHAWRENGYRGASATSITLLNHWFDEEHLLESADGTLSPFRYYYAQREAVETVIWLHEVKQARDKFDLMRFDASGIISTGMFPEDWPRYVLKLATGSGKTKVLSLLIAWCYYHKLYEPDSPLARNFLLIAPNIIVLDRLRADFDGLRIFFKDPVLPPNGTDGKDWRDDFQLTLHIQDDVRVQRPTGNLFLTNIHRVFMGDIKDPSLEDDDLSDYFLAPFGARPTGKTTDSKADLGEIVREIEELAVFNDEAHHIHDERMAWFKSIQDIHLKLLQRDARLAIQIDVTATPKHNNGAIFVQTVSDYPLVEAIHQNVVKHPILPDAESRAKLRDPESIRSPKPEDKYADYLQLGVEEWRKSRKEHAAMGKKAVLFVMLDDTRNCDTIGEYLQRICPELEDKVLVIHTVKNGEISEAASGKKKEELEALRKAANTIDTWDSPYEAIVSVLMLKEGWDVRNVTVIVGLRKYGAESEILPEQTLGRGLRRMYFGSDVPETVSVLGTPAFMEFVERIQLEGVTLERRAMGGGATGREPLLVEVDRENPAKDIAQLDIELPRLGRRYQRQYQGLETLDPAAFGNPKLPVRSFTPEETREITFKRMLDGEVDHTILLAEGETIDHRTVVAFFARQLLKDLHLVGGYEVLYPRVRDFLRDHLFDRVVDLDDPVIVRNLSEPEAAKLVYDSFKAAINALTITEQPAPHIEDRIRLSATRPFRTEPRPFVVPRKSVFNKIVGEAVGGGFELTFAAFLEAADDVLAFAKNYMAVGFRLDYVKADGDLSTYTPDFIVRHADGTVYIVETKGRKELDLPMKMQRLAQYCADATAAEPNGTRYELLFVDQDSYARQPPRNFASLVASYKEYKPGIQM